MCKVNHDQQSSLADACADESEVLAISVMRFVTAAYMTGDAACWDAAHDCADQVLGPKQGPGLVAVMAGLVRALRAERSAPWRFMPASCRRVTDDEHQLIRLLALGRQERFEALRDGAAELVGGTDAPRLTLAAQMAAEALDRIQACLGPAPAPQPSRSTALH